MEGLGSCWNGLEGRGVRKQCVEVVDWVIVVYSGRGCQDKMVEMVGEGSGELPESRGSTGWPPRGGPPFAENMGYR